MPADNPNDRVTLGDLVPILEMTALWIILIIMLCVGLAVNALRSVQTGEDLRRYRQEPTINTASLPDVGTEGPRLTRGDDSSV